MHAIWVSGDDGHQSPPGGDGHQVSTGDKGHPLDGAAASSDAAPEEQEYNLLGNYEKLELTIVKKQHSDRS